MDDPTNDLPDVSSDNEIEELMAQLQLAIELLEQGPSVSNSLTASIDPITIK